MKELICMTDLKKYDEIIKGWDGFIDPEGYFYKVKEMGEKDDCDHLIWVDTYLKHNLYSNFSMAKLLEVKEILSKKDPVDYMVNYLGFIYYSHETEFYQPLVGGPNPRINGKKATTKQLEKLMKIMLINNENPFENSLLMGNDDTLYIDRVIK